jgi:hypothetical protein
MNKFFDQLKHHLIEQEGDKLSLLIPHYENLLQHEEGLKAIIDDSELYELDFNYEDCKYEGYTDGSISIYVRKNVGGLIESEWGNYYQKEDLDYHYEIKLLNDDRYWRYCNCKPEHEAHQCCGDGCDWVAPRFELVKISHLSHGSFDGYQRDMWKLDKKWEEELSEFKESKQKEELEYIENQIKELEERKRNLN